MAAKNKGIIFLGLAKSVLIPAKIIYVWLEKSLLLLRLKSRLWRRLSESSWTEISSDASLDIAAQPRFTKDAPADQVFMSSTQRERQEFKDVMKR